MGDSLPSPLKSVCQFIVTVPGCPANTGGSWLVGGASNTGGAVLKRYFTNQQLQQLSARIDPSHPTGLDYYPLTQAGERFPVNDPYLQPRLEPRPADDAIYLQGVSRRGSELSTVWCNPLARLGSCGLSSRQFCISHADQLPRGN